MHCHAMVGLIHWHAPLALLTPGLWALLAGLTLTLLPANRWRLACELLLSASILLLALLALRAAWRSNAALGLLLDGWLRSGWLQVALALGAALTLAWGPTSMQARRFAAGWLLVLWSLPLGGLIAYHEAEPARRPMLAAALLSSLVLAPLVPMLAPIPMALAIAAALPRWRVAAAAIMLAALLGLFVRYDGKTTPLQEQQPTRRPTQHRSTVLKKELRTCLHQGVRLSSAPGSPA